MRCWSRTIALAVGWYYLSTLLVILGSLFGDQFLTRTGYGSNKEKGFVAALTAWDGQWYASVVRSGYQYQPGRRSSIAFFPCLPGVAWCVHKCVGTSPEVSLLLVSHAALLTAFVCLACYAASRASSDPLAAPDRVDWTLVAFGLWPLTCFFRFGYSESVFLATVALVFCGMEFRWRVWVVALLAGAVTSTRPTGVAIVPFFLFYLFEVRKSWRAFFCQSLLLLPLACWGILGFMVWQYAQFGDALAFIRVQEAWAREVLPWKENAWGTLTLRPIFGNFWPASTAFWGQRELHSLAVFSLEFANPLYFAATAILVAAGWRRGVLNPREALFATLVLLIPYVTHANRCNMMAQARYASVALPVYLVMARILESLPRTLAAILVAYATCFLVFYAALFSAWYRIY